MAAIVLVAVAAAFLPKFLAERLPERLVLSNGNTGAVYASYPLSDGEEFSITFIHSVNKTPVTDVYNINDDGKVLLLRTVYYDFGAGVPFDLNEGETLSFDDNGAMIIDGINREIPDFLIFVGTVSDHTLQIGDSQISLRDLCGRNAKVRIACRHAGIKDLFQK